MYDWRLDSGDALFAVDLSLYSTSPNPDRAVLAYICYSKNDESRLSDSDARRIDAYADKISRKLGYGYAGYIQTALKRQYYIYIGLEEEYELIKAMAEKQKRLCVQVGSKNEASWASYFKLLYPDAAKLQTVRNGETLKKLYDNGDSTAPRRLNIHMYFRTESIRLQYEETARREGFAIGTSEEREQSELPYGVVLHRICALKKRDVDAVTVQAIRIAERYGGRLLFWDCPIVPRHGK